MARTETFYARVQPELKAKAEAILANLGMTSSDAVNIFLHQVVLRNGLPFEVTIPKPTREEVFEWLSNVEKQADEDYANGDCLTIDQVKERLNIG